MSDKYFPDCMVDIETTGLHPDRSAMIQLAGVKFNLETREISHDFFNRCLLIPPWRFWQESTWDWWSSNKFDILTSIYQRMEDPQVVVEAFTKWAEPGSRWWSKPSHFDFPFVSSYCADFGLQMPFDFRAANDMRSFMRGRSFPAQMVEPRPEFQGTAHNAIHDCLHQIRILFEFLDQEKTNEPS